jgi:chromosome segregation ATPase
MVHAKRAAICTTEWTVSGSKSEGTKMTNRNIKLMLRSFNNESDAAVLKVSWNNVQKMRERIMKAYEALNKLGEPNKIAISSDYMELKIKEIELAYEYQEKLQAEKEEQRRIREQMREEEKVRREIEKTLQETMREQEVYNSALEKARQEMESAQGEKLEALKSQIDLLQEKLAEAEEKNLRAQSMAEKTKSGHVYVISNIGSFGKDVFKIGLTRRLEPEERVKELGDASVPFSFDIHAMIYSENAPELEN